jgi:hypothetical protein
MYVNQLMEVYPKALKDFKSLAVKYQPYSWISSFLSNYLYGGIFQPLLLEEGEKKQLFIILAFHFLTI